MRSYTARIAAFVLILCAFSFLAFGIYSHVYTVSATTEEDIAKQKSDKQKQLDAIIAEINKISASQGSLSQKIKDMQTEKTRLDAVIASIKSDTDAAEKLALDQEKELDAVAQKYALNHALSYLENEKGIGILLLGTSDLSDLVEKFAYFQMQEKVAQNQAEYIATKQQAIKNQKVQLESDRKLIQSSLDNVNQQLAQLYVQQEQLAQQLRSNSAAKSSLTTDISNLSKQEQQIIAGKSGGAPTSGGGSGSGTGGGSTGGGTIINTRAILITVDGVVVKSTDETVKVSVPSSGNMLVNRSCGGCMTPDMPYQGDLVFNKNARLTFSGAEGTKTVNVVNELPIDLYLRGLGEMPSYWGRSVYGGIEALKAQTVAARTYASKKAAESPRNWAFDIYDTTDDQNYVGVSKVFATDGQYWDSAVSATAGTTMRIGGKYTGAYYSSSSGGYSYDNFTSTNGKTDRYDSNGSWTDYGLNIPAGTGTTTSYWQPAGSSVSTQSDMVRYGNASIFLDPDGDGNLVSATERYKLTNGFDWKASLGTNTIENRVGTISAVNQIYNDGSRTILRDTKYTSSVEFVGDKGTIVVSAVALKTAYNLISPGKNAIWSTLFDVKKVSNGWELWSRGFGHRVGMSQYGAFGRARAGQDFRTILQAYYPGSDIVQYGIGRNIRVGLTKVGQRESVIKSTSDLKIYEGGALLRIVPPNTVIKIAYN